MRDPKRWYGHAFDPAKYGISVGPFARSGIVFTGF